ncbi:MAG: hypothetical protein HF978_07990 [Desulfobacteraceae bacterium]|nr:Slp family lipoprotein [Desulfobacteraceae bacterium]MBC2755470.1 hypothetical protein [Desulfobacteraceae bacterium]
MRQPLIHIALYPGIYGLSIKDVIKDPDVHKGKTVLISGIILGSRNTKEGTLIEILQKPADIDERPKDVDDSDGRFLALRVFGYSNL